MSLHLDILASGNAQLILGPDLRAETTIHQAEHAHAWADSIDLALKCRTLGLDVLVVLRLMDVVQAADPALELVRWISEETEPRIRRGLVAALAHYDEEAQ